YICLSESCFRPLRALDSFPARRSSDLTFGVDVKGPATNVVLVQGAVALASKDEARGAVRLEPGQRSRVVALDAPEAPVPADLDRSEEHTSELQSRENLVCRLLLEKKIT